MDQFQEIKTAEGVTTPAEQRAVLFNFEKHQFEVAAKAPVPSCGEDELRVRVVACSLNPVDAKYDFWASFIAPERKTKPFVVGLDIAGIVDKVGPQAAKTYGFKPGDAVVYHGNLVDGHGGLAEYSVTKAIHVLRLPAGLSMYDAAAIPCAAWTAYQAIHDKLHVTKGSTVLITGASGGVGLAAVQIAAALGADTIIGSCSAARAETVKQAGATHVIDYKSEDVPARVMEITGQEGVDAVLDCVSADSAKECTVKCLGFNGAIVSIVGPIQLNESEAGNAFVKVRLLAVFLHS